MTWRFGLRFLSVTGPRPGNHREFPDDHGMFRPSRTFEGTRLTALHFRLESGPSARRFCKSHPLTCHVQDGVGLSKVLLQRFDRFVRRQNSQVDLALLSFALP